MIADAPDDYTHPPPVFISYQWGIQQEVRLLKKHLGMAGYQAWMDIGQMGGGDKLYEKIDTGIRAAQVVICCVTDKYALSPNCNREVSYLAYFSVQLTIMTRAFNSTLISSFQK